MVGICWTLLRASFFRFEFYFLVLFSLWSTLFEAMVDLLFSNFLLLKNGFGGKLGLQFAFFSFLDVGFFTAFCQQSEESGK